MNRILNLYKRSRNEAKKHPCLPRKILLEAGKHLPARYAAMGRDESLRCEAIPSCPRESILTHNGCQVRLLQRINTQIPNRLVCLHRCQQCYAHQVPSIPDALEINLIPDIDTHTDTRCKAAMGFLVYMKSMGLFLALWSGLHPCLYAVPGLSPSTLGPPGPPLLICGFWGFSLHSQMGAEIRPAPATMAVRCGFSKESTHKFKLRTNLFVFIASNNAMLTRFPVSQMLSKST